MSDPGTAPYEPGVLEPAALYPPADVPEVAVLCFFPGTVERAAREPGTRRAYDFFTLVESQSLYEREVDGVRVGFCYPEIGAPRAVMFLEEAIARGVRRFVAVGSAGVLVPELVLGHPVVVTSALRDEGTSRHYGATEQVLEAPEAAVRACTEALDAAGVAYTTGRTWTTDAIYRETRPLVRERIEAGCVVVEMEASAFLAVARMRGVLMGQILFSADSLAGESWDGRAWHTQDDAHDAVFRLALDAAARLARA